MPTKIYRIQYRLDDAVAQTAVKRAIAGLRSIESAALRAATAMEGAFARAGTAAEQAARRASVAYAAAAGTINRAQTQAQTRAPGGNPGARGTGDLGPLAPQGRVGRVPAEEAHVDIGLAKLQVDGLKLQDRLQAAAARRAAADARAADASVKAQLVGIDALRASGLKLQDQLQKAAARRAAADAKASQAAIDSQLVGIDSLRASGIKLQDDLARKASQAAAQKQKEAERLDKLQDQILLRDYKRRVAYERKKIEDAKRAAEEQAKVEKARIDRINDGVLAFSKSIVGIQSISTVMSTITSHFSEAADAAYNAGKMVADYRQALLELAALKGKLGGSTQAAKEELLFRAQTLQTAESAREFQSIALGVGQAAIGKQITEDEFKKALVMAGKFQAAEGGTASAHGTLVGLIPLLSEKQTTAEDVFRKEQQLYKIFQPGGFKFSSGIEQFTELAPLITSGSYKDTELAALLSAFSTSKIGSGKAATAVEQFTRSTIGALGRMRGTKLEDTGYDVQKTGEYLKSIGATTDFAKQTPATELPFKIADMIVADLQKQEAAATKRGESFVPYQYLKAKGYGNQEDVEALLLYSGLKKTGVLDKTFMPLAREEAKPTAQEAIAPVEQAQRVDPAMQARKAALAAELSKFSVGAGKEEYTTNLLQVAFERLKARGEVSGEFGSETKNVWAKWTDELIFGQRHKMEIEAQRMLFGEAERLGIVPQGTAGKNFQFIGRDALFELATKINAKGGQSIPGLEGLTNQAVKQLDQAARFEQGTAPTQAIDNLIDALNRNTAAHGGKPAGAAPAPPPPRPRAAPAALPAAPRGVAIRP